MQSPSCLSLGLFFSLLGCPVQTATAVCGAWQVLGEVVQVKLIQGEGTVGSRWSCPMCPDWGGGNWTCYPLVTADAMNRAGCWGE